MQPNFIFSLTYRAVVTIIFVFVLKSTAVFAEHRDTHRDIYGSITLDSIIRQQDETGQFGNVQLPGIYFDLSTHRYVFPEGFDSDDDTRSVNGVIQQIAQLEGSISISFDNYAPGILIAITDNKRNAFLFTSQDGVQLLDPSLNEVDTVSLIPEVYGQNVDLSGRRLTGRIDEIYQNTDRNSRIDEVYTDTTRNTALTRFIPTPRPDQPY